MLEERKIMRWALVFIFIAMFSFPGFVPQAHAQKVGPPIVVGNPEASFLGLPRWLRDSQGIQLGICDQGGGALGDPPCPGFLPGAGTTPSEGMYYSATADMVAPAVSLPNGERFVISFFLEAAAADPILLEPATVISGLRVRLRNLVVPGRYQVQTPVGNFRFRAIAGVPIADIDQIVPLDPNITNFALALSGLVNRFRSNGTAAAPDPLAEPPALTAFPGFIGNGVTPARLNGDGIGTIRVIGPPGSGINVVTRLLAVEGKLFSTPTAQAGGLVVERGTMGRDTVGRGVLFATTNVTGGGMQITSIAGVDKNPPITMTADPTTPGRFFASFPMRRVAPPETEVGIAVTVLDNVGAPVPELQDLPIIMQDTVTSTGATFRRGILRVNGASTLPGAAGAPGARLTVQAVDAAGIVGATLGSINKATGNLILPGQATAPPAVKIQSSLGGSVTVPVRGAVAADKVTIARAVFNRATGRLIVIASSNATPAAVLTVQSVNAQGVQVGADLGTITGPRFALPGLTVPPSFVKVVSGNGGSNIVPVTIQ